MYYEDPSEHVPQCVKEAATEYIEKGMSPEDAYCKAYAKHAEKKLMQERYKLEQRKKRLDEKLPKSPEADNKKFYDEQYKRRLNQCPKEGGKRRLAWS